MAFEEALKTISVEAGSDLSASQYAFVTVNSSGQLALSTAGAASDGVLQDKPSAAGSVGAVGITGVTKVLAGEAIAAGDDVAVGSSGKAAVAASGEVIVARALEAASGDGAVFAAILSLQRVL